MLRNVRPEHKSSLVLSDIFCCGKKYANFSKSTSDDGCVGFSFNNAVCYLPHVSTTEGNVKESLSQNRI